MSDPQNILRLFSTTESCHLKGAAHGGPSSLPSRRYHLKVDVDAKERLKSDWNSTLGDAELVGQTIIESKWPTGYGEMTTVKTSRVKQ